MSRHICDGMEYTYQPDTGELFNNYGTLVAIVVEDEAKEYYLFLTADGTLMYEAHASLISDVARTLVEQFTVYEQG